MARISASIPEDLKDALYRAATDEDQPISHIIADALRVRLGSERAPSQEVGGTASVAVTDISRKLDRLTAEVQDLKSALTSRTPPKGARFF